MFNGNEITIGLSAGLGSYVSRDINTCPSVIDANRQQDERGSLGFDNPSQSDRLPSTYDEIINICPR